MKSIKLSAACHTHLRFMVIVVGIATCWGFHPLMARQDDDPEERAFLKATAKRALTENCLICHSDDLIVSQRLSPTQWKAEVEKMVGWGAPLPKEDHAKVIAYLSEEYPTAAPKKSPERVTLKEALTPELPAMENPLATRGDGTSGEARFLKDCATCHGRDGQGADLGSNLVEKSVLYQPTEFAKVVKEGRGRMPGFKDLVNAEANADMLEWLRGKRYSARQP